MKPKAKRRPALFVLSRKMQKSILAFLVFLIFLGFFWAAEELTTTRLPASDAPPLLYANQVRDDLEMTFSTAINEARHSVLLMIYTLTDPKVIQALKQKSEEGVDVRVICDGKASPFADRKLGTKVKTLKRFGDGLMHQKILVVDGAQVWIGSANMTGESLRMHGNLVTAMHSPALGQMIHEKAAAMPEEGRGAAISHRQFLLGGQNLEMWFLPDDKGAVRKLKGMIESAQKTVRVAMFTWTRKDLAQAVVEAAKRGVKVEVVLDHFAGNGAGAHVAKFLKTNGIPVFLSQGSALLHHKFMYIDGETLVNGSANWTKAAFTQNDDCFLVLHNLSDQQKSQMDRLWDVIKKESTPLK